MDELRNRQIIEKLKRKWQFSILAACFLAGTAITLVIISLGIWFFKPGWTIVPVGLIISVIASCFLFYKKLIRQDIISFLNRSQPGLQESAGLLVKDPNELNFLEKLQAEKTALLLTQNIAQPSSIRKQVKIACTMFAGSVLLFLAVFLFPLRPSVNIAYRPASVTKETKLPGVTKVIVSVTPPAYLAIKTKRQDKLNITAEEGAVVSWELSTSIRVEQLRLVFNDKSVLALTPTDSTRMHWAARKNISTTGFYQIQLNTTMSELYRIEVLKDAFPSIVVRSPKSTSLIEPGRPRKTQLEVLLSDDHAVKSATISATVASGNGEAVKFKKQQLVFTDFSPGKSVYQLTKQIDLSTLGMSDGDELYFYISATDSRNQEKRSDVFIVRIEDVAQLLDIEGLLSGIDVKPEFFRSQRQIIIETEQLLKGRDTIRPEIFNARSNELGVDQKLLRLRYGKFLGEETNVEIGKDHDDHDHEGSTHTETSDAGNAQKMMDAVAHKHDNAEDAGFFDAQTKKQLKATLDEMWKAELQLRTLKPAEALPFEYKALKLLKELQQQSRVYVGKTGSRTPPLKPEKRLSGELDKIVQQEQQKNYQPASETEVDRKALGILEQLKNKEVLTPASLSVLELAGIHLGNKASDNPGLYLPGFEAYRKILSGHFNMADIATAGNALQKMLAAAYRMPGQKRSSPAKKISQQYFINLIRDNG